MLVTSVQRGEDRRGWEDSAEEGCGVAAASSLPHPWMEEQVSIRAGLHLLRGHRNVSGFPVRVYFLFKLR